MTEDLYVWVVWARTDPARIVHNRVPMDDPSSLDHRSLEHWREVRGWETNDIGWLVVQNVSPPHEYVALTKTQQRVFDDYDAAVAFANLAL